VRIGTGPLGLSRSHSELTRYHGVLRALGFAAAVGAAGASAFLLPFCPWFLVLSVALMSAVIHKS